MWRGGVASLFGWSAASNNVVIIDRVFITLFTLLLKSVNIAQQITFGGGGFTEKGFIGDPMDFFFFSVTTGGGVSMLGF